MSSLNTGLAFLAGVLSFVSPCTLPLYPTYLSYITGISYLQLKERDNQKEIRWKVITHTLFFILGVSLIYMVIGYSASLVGGLFIDHKDIVRKISGAVMVFMGLLLIGVIKPTFFLKQFQFNLKRKSTGYLSSFVVGAGFAAGWTPCIGPIFGAIISLAAAHPGEGFGYILAYVAGFAFPFIVFSFFIGSTRLLLKYSSLIMKIGGAVMIVVGVLLFMDKLAQLAVYFNKIIPFQPL